jgi:hypothetical protein
VPARDLEFWISLRNHDRHATCQPKIGQTHSDADVDKPVDTGVGSGAIEETLQSKSNVLLGPNGSYPDPEHCKLL